MRPLRSLVAGRCLGEIVRKMGDRVLPDVLPILRSGLDSDDPATRAGVCVGLAEVIEASSERQLEEHMDELMPAIRLSLCDALPAVSR